MRNLVSRFVRWKWAILATMAAEVVFVWGAFFFGASPEVKMGSLIVTGAALIFIDIKAKEGH